MKNKDELVKSILSLLPRAQEDANRIATSTAPADRVTAEQAVIDLYRVNGKDKPVIFWVDSPFEALTFIDLYTKVDIPDGWKAQVAAEMKKGPAPYIETYACGQQHAIFIRDEAEFEKMANGETLEYLERLYCFQLLAHSCHWSYFFDEAAIMCERPLEVHLNSDFAPHNTSGPAQVYRDGNKWFAVNGVLVPERVVTDPLSYTKQEILDINNSEQTRVLAERMGWEIFIDRIGGKVIDTWRCEKGLTYELIKLKTKFGELQPLFLKMLSPVLKDGENPSYVEPVDHRLKSAQAARKWQYVLEGWEDESQADEWVEYCNKNPELIVGIET